MPRDKPATTTIDWNGLPETAAIALALLTALTALAQHRTDLTSCFASTQSSVEQTTVPEQHSLDLYATIRDTGERD
jgi:hypothetical protein